MGYFSNAGVILVQFVFGALVVVVALRVLLQLVRANFYNPICQMLYKFTNPILMPLRRVIPAWRNLDLAAVLLAYAIESVKAILLSALAGHVPAISALLILALALLIEDLLMLYFGLVLIRVVLSFAGGGGYSPVVPLIYQLTEPVLAPLRRTLPPISGLDFSPLLVMLGIYLVGALVVAPLFDLAKYLAL